MGNRDNKSPKQFSGNDQNSSLSILDLFVDQYDHQSFLGNFFRSRSMTKMLVRSYPRRGAGSVQANGDVFSQN